MPLPGMLAIGFLEEDNPSKAYFRFMPIGVLENERLRVPEELEGKYPDDGFIRIVPDKNEMMDFKNRMRGLGGYCALDLRRYPNENEKIRANKNYGAANEVNASIVYSDVIARVPADRALQVLDAQYVFVGEEVTLRTGIPGTEYVLLQREETLMGPWEWREDREMAGCIVLRHADGIPYKTMPRQEAADCLFTIGYHGTSYELLTKPDLFGVGERLLQKAEAPEMEPQRAMEAPEVPEPVEIPETMGTPEIPEAPEPPGESIREEPPAAKPEAARQPRAIRDRVNFREQVLQAQSGINPRRGRSLPEIVDEQWRRSRYEQLGHPVPPEASGRPVLSPIDHAVGAVMEAWSIPEARGGLLKGLLQDEELRDSLMEALGIHAEQMDRSADERMDEMQAEKLRLIADIDALRIRRADMKQELMEDLRRAHKHDFEVLSQRNQVLKEEIECNKAVAREAEKAAQAAQRLLSRESDKLLDKMVEQAAAARAVQRILESAYNGPQSHPELYQPSAGELLSDLRVQLDAAGFGMSNDQAVCMLLSLASGGLVVISGPAGCGKSKLVRSLAHALGLTRENGRFLQATHAKDDRVEGFLDRMDGLTPSLLLLDDANMPDVSGAMEEAVRLSERAQAMELPLLIVLTVQDAPEGLALSARLLGRAFFLRMDAPAPDHAWKPAPITNPSAQRAVALSSLRQILAPGQDVPGMIEERLERLRKALEEIGYRLDRRTLNETWSFCSRMARMSRLQEADILDLALCQRVLPAMLAGMELKQLIKLPELLCDMPRCMALMDTPLPLPPL